MSKENAKEQVEKIKSFFRSRQSVRILKDELEESKQDLNCAEEELVRSFSVAENKVFGPFSLVKLSCSNEESYGISRKSEFDSMDGELGYSIAFGRAKVKLLEKIKNDRHTHDIYAG